MGQDINALLLYMVSYLLLFLASTLVFIWIRLKSYALHTQKGKVFVQVIFAKGDERLKKVYGWVHGNVFATIYRGDKNSIRHFILENKTEAVIYTTDIIILMPIKSGWHSIWFNKLKAKVG